VILPGPTAKVLADYAFRHPASRRSRPSECARVVSVCVVSTHPAEHVGRASVSRRDTVLIVKLKRRETGSDGFVTPIFSFTTVVARVEVGGGL
jgi:hypothetical protein